MTEQQMKATMAAMTPAVINQNEEFRRVCVATFSSPLFEQAVHRMKEKIRPRGERRK